MHKFFFLLIFTFSTAFSATILIEPGETISIYPDQETTVSCGDGGPGTNCKRAVDILSSGLVNCLKSYNGSYERTSQCIPSIWKDFKTQKPNCIFEGRQACTRICVKYYNGSYERTSQCRATCN